MSVRLPTVDTCFGGDLTKPSIIIASVDRFYLNLVICLQLDIAFIYLLCHRTRSTNTIIEHRTQEK